MPPKAPVKKPAPKAAVKPAAKGGAGAKPAAGKAVPAKKGAPPAKGKAANATTKGAAAEAPKKKVWTKEDDAARKIQTKIRQYLAKKVLQKKKQAKIDYEELMEKLEKEAFVKMVKMEQEQYEKERQQQEEERRRKAEERKRIKRMLEAAFEGDRDEVLTVLKEVADLDNKNGIGNDVIGRGLRQKHELAIVECEDANNNTPLSEAASGGNVDTIKLLLERGADVNSRGQFDRTPLYRAAFAGHLEACEVLLQHGADPRLYANDGSTPESIASIAPIVELLGSWDISQTENILVKLETEKEKRAEIERQRKAAETSKIEEQIKEAQREYDIAQKTLNKEYCEMNKRITEHDKAVTEGFAKTDITLQMIHDSEADVEVAKINCEKAREKLAQLKLKLREKEKEGMAEEDLPGIKVNIKELDDVLLRDVGNKIKESGKWPLLIDPSSQACTFLRYRDTNYLNALNPAQMEPEKVRLAVLGSVRYGKSLVLDMMEVDMFDTVSDRFDEVHKGLMNMIMDKSLLKDEAYTCLLRKGDPQEYDKNKFIENRVQNFKFVIITKNPLPPAELLERTYAIRIHINTM